MLPNAIKLGKLNLNVLVFSASANAYGNRSSAQIDIVGGSLHAVEALEKNTGKEARGASSISSRVINNICGG